MTNRPVTDAELELLHEKFAARSLERMMEHLLKQLGGKR